MSENDVVRLQEQVKTLFSDIAELKSDLQELTKEVKCLKEKLSERLPNWATVVLSILTCAVGWLVGR